MYGFKFIGTMVGFLYSCFIIVKFLVTLRHWIRHVMRNREWNQVFGCSLIFPVFVTVVFAQWCFNFGLAPHVMNHRRDIKYRVVKCPFKPKTQSVFNYIALVWCSLHAHISTSAYVLSSFPDYILITFPYVLLIIDLNLK